MLSGVVLVAGLTACGSDKGDSDKSNKGSDKAAESVGGPLAALKLASQQTDQQHSAKVEGTTKMGTQNSTMSGAMDWADGMRANMTITQTGGSVQNSPLAGKPMEARYTPDAMFMNLGPEFAAQAGGKHWMKYDYDTLAKQAGASGEFLKDQMQNTDPARSVQLLIATGQVKSVGSESVKGVKATHYTGTVKVSELAKMQSKDLTQSDLEALQKQLETSGMETETIDLWIDGDNLLVKKREQAESNNGTYDSTVFYSDYGTKVTVEEPPTSDTMNFEDALGQQS
ncbi:LolA-like protein [Streptomyces milbemycinicus]|uniref:Lipoprotein n=1 Tax=Streptomyces milbemycinicus TaxID=476552 RepID=A0ABW8LST6_9ACTN